MLHLFHVCMHVRFTNRFDNRLICRAKNNSALRELCLWVKLLENYARKKHWHNDAQSMRMLIDLFLFIWSIWIGEYTNLHISDKCVDIIFLLVISASLADWHMPPIVFFLLFIRQTNLWQTSNTISTLFANQYDKPIRNFASTRHFIWVTYP